MEDPILFLSNDDDDKMATLKNLFNKLSADNQKKVTALHDSNPSGDPDQKIARIFESNCIEGW